MYHLTSVFVFIIGPNTPYHRARAEGRSSTPMIVVDIRRRLNIIHVYRGFLAACLFTPSLLCLDGRSTSIADNSANYCVSLIWGTSIEIHTSTQPLMYLLQIHSRRHGGGGFDKNTVRGRGLSLVGVSGRRGGAVRWSLISLDPQYINQFTSVG